MLELYFCKLTSRGTFISFLSQKSKKLNLIQYPPKIFPFLQSFYTFEQNLFHLLPALAFNVANMMFMLQYLLAQFPLSIPDGEGELNRITGAPFAHRNRRRAAIADLSTLFRHFH